MTSDKSASKNSDKAVRPNAKQPTVERATQSTSQRYLTKPNREAANDALVDPMWADVQPHTRTNRRIAPIESRSPKRQTTSNGTRLPRQLPQPAPQPLSVEERRQLRQSIQDANRDLYRDLYHR